MGFEIKLYEVPAKLLTNNEFYAIIIIESKRKEVINHEGSYYVYRERRQEI